MKPEDDPIEAPSPDAWPNRPERPDPGRQDCRPVLVAPTTDPSPPAPVRRRTSVARYLTAALEQEGVRYIFGIPGSPLASFFESLVHESGVRPILVRHEEGGAFMADGYARFSGTLGACWGTSGPGTTNALTGLATSLMDAVPVLMICGQVPTASFYKGAFQESTAAGVDSVALLRAVTKNAAMAVTAAQVPTLVKMLLREALTGRRGPTALVIPKDCLGEDLDGPPPPVFSYRVGNRCFDARMVGRAAALLARAQRPAFLAGTGVSMSGANRQLVDLAEALGAGVATTPKAKGCFPEDHALAVGVLGLGGHPSAARWVLAEADVVVAVGTSLGQIATNNFDPRLAQKTLIHIDVDPAEIGKNFPVEVGLVGDAQVVLKELLLALGTLRQEALRVERMRTLASFQARVPRFFDMEVRVPDSSPVHPRRVIAELNRALPDDAIVFWDSGNHNLWGVHYFRSRLPRTFTYSPGFGAMGYGVSACIGAALARPGQLVVSVCGDGGFLMNGMEVSTAVNHGIPVIWVVFNDQRLGMVEDGHRAICGREAVGMQIRGADFVKIAEGLGARGFPAATGDEFRLALLSAMALRAPAVIDVRIDPTAVPPVPFLRPELARAL